MTDPKTFIKVERNFGGVSVGITMPLSLKSSQEAEDAAVYLAEHAKNAYERIITDSSPVTETPKEETPKETVVDRAKKRFTEKKNVEAPTLNPTVDNELKETTKKKTTKKKATKKKTAKKVTKKVEESSPVDDIPPIPEEETTTEKTKDEYLEEFQTKFDEYLAKEMGAAYDECEDEEYTEKVLDFLCVETEDKITIDFLKQGLTNLEIIQRKGSEI